MALIELICSPGVAVERPSIGLSTLKQVLAHEGIPSIVRYANLWYAEYVGLEISQYLSYLHPREAIFDWLFAGVAFPDFHPHHDEYLDSCFLRFPRLKHHLSKTQLMELRRGAAEFVDITAHRLLADDPQIIGCTSTFAQHCASLAILRRIRDLNSSVITIMGGANCEAIMGLTTHRNFEWVDFVVSGEAEELVLPLVHGILEQGRELPQEALPEGVYGPQHRQQQSHSFWMRESASRAVVKDMKRVPVPDYSDFFAALDESSCKNQIRPGLSLETSRGCWWGERMHCTFCGLNGGTMQFRSKSEDVVLLELSCLSSKYDIFDFQVVDNILDTGYLSGLLPRLAAEGSPYRFFYEIKANLTRQQVEVLSSAGVLWVQPGIESLDTRILRLVRKGCTPWQNIALLKWCRQYGIRVLWNILYGVPGEEDFWYYDQAKLLPLLTHLEPCNISQIEYCRFSPYHTDQSTYSLSLVPCASFEYVYPLPRDELSNLVYFFDDVSIKQKQNGLPNVFGATEFMQKVIDWQNSWKGDDPPLCVCFFKEEKCFVLDTRPCAKENLTAISPLAARVLECADSGLKLDALVIKLGKQANQDLEELHSTLRDLLDRGFLIEIDGRFISVVLETPVRKLLDETAFPGGHVD